MSGGVLGILNSIGGSILSLLVGKDAWIESDTSLYLRPILGGLFLGAVIGGIIGFLYEQWYFIPVGSIIIAGMGGLLESIRRELH